jgi:hypothetical protein
MGVPESGIRRTLKLAYARISPSVTVYSVSKITLADYAIVSQGSTLCAASHDIEDPHFQTTAPSIMIGARAWVAAEAFVGPGSPSAKAQSSGREDARFAISNLGRFTPAIQRASSNAARSVFSAVLMPSLLIPSQLKPSQLKPSQLKPSQLKPSQLKPSHRWRRAARIGV